MSKVIELIHDITAIGFYACLTLDSFLIFLTHFSIERDFGAYKWLISGFAVTGIVFSAVEHAVTPILHNFNSGIFIFTVKRPLHAPLWVVEVLLASCGGFLGITISMLAVQFMYRYLAILSPRKTVHFHGFKLILWFCYPLLTGMVETLSIYHFSSPDHYSWSYFKDEMFHYYGINLTTTVHFAGIPYDNSDPSNTTIRWNNIFYFLASCMVLSIQYSIMLFCGYHMNKRVKSMTTCTSPTLRRLHRQFFKALTLQIIVPSVIIFIPLILVLVVPLLDYRINFPTGIFFGLFSLYPAIDVLIIIYIVSEYSKAVKSLLFFSFRNILDNKIMIENKPSSNIRI